MTFDVGDKVALVDDMGTLAKKGATAFVTGHKDPWLIVKWVRDELSLTQSDGCYFPRVFVKVEQESATLRSESLARGERMDEYGHPRESFDRIALLWNTYLAVSGVDERDLEAADVAKMMILLKLSRTITGGKGDTLDDIEGYVECLRMLKEDD